MRNLPIAATLGVALLLTGAIAHAVPDDQELALRGARIGHIEIQVDDVFERTQRALAAPYRVANTLHVSTRADTIGQQLLFHEGDLFDRRLFDESARMLRDQRYLNEASVEVIGFNDIDNTVDVLVRVHDVWTLSPGVSLGRKGGKNSTRIEFEDTNFLGLGKQLSLERSANVDRTAWRFGYVNPNLLGSRWRLTAAHGTASDGTEDVFAIARPFYALDSRWSFGAGAGDVGTTESRYSLGHIVDQFGMQHSAFEMGGGWSAGLHDGFAARYLAGVRYDEHTFTALNGTTGAVPDDRVLAYPWVGIEVLEDQYRTTHNLDQIGRTEDLYLGRSARFEAGFASTAFGSTRDAFMLNGRMQMASQLTEAQYLINTVTFGGRFEEDELRNATFDIGSRWYLRQSPHRVLFAAASATVVAYLDPEQQLLLGGDNGLRGYPLRYQAGTSRALFTLEERFYSNWQPFKLVNVGAAVFFDAGRTWGHDDFAAPSLGLLKDVGVGLRLGSARSGLGNVLHVDIAFPLDGDPSIDSLQLLIETKRSF